jgi:hypothetical protein
VIARLIIALLAVAIPLAEPVLAHRALSMITADRVSRVTAVDVDHGGGVR